MVDDHEQVSITVDPTRWDLLTRPVPGTDFTHHGVDTLTEMAGRMRGLLRELSTPEVVASALRHLDDFVAGVQQGGAQSYVPVIDDVEYCLAMHAPRLYAVIDARRGTARGKPIEPGTRIAWYARVTHDGWYHWVYVPETGRFHLHPTLWEGLYGDEDHMELVPASVHDFRAALAAGAVTSIRQALTWASVAVEDCAPELLWDGPLPEQDREEG